MSRRTDLAIEEDIVAEGIKSEEKHLGDVKITTIEIGNSKTAEKFGKKRGKYITVEFTDIEKISDYTELKEGIILSLKSLFKESPENILVVGLGNREITADSIGPRVAERMLATRHIAGDFAQKIGLHGLRSVSVVTPNVLGKTGIEATELVAGLVNKIKPQAVIAIDACVSLSINRLFKTIQLSNSGISPGSGVKNSRKELSFKTLGVPVIALGIPTVVDAAQLAFELTGEETKINTDLIVTPKESDLLCHRISEILSEALNVFLQPEIEEEILFELV